ncbi:hypothetical protein ACN469_17750 [Corallococcus terminator]
MKTLRNALLTLTATVTLVPAAAVALPPPCAEICFEPDSCREACSIGVFLSTCRRAGYCEEVDEAEELMSSVSRQDAWGEEETAPVCDEARQREAVEG